MPTKHLKLIVLIAVAVAVFSGCAKRAPLELPPPIINPDASQGWHSY